MLEYTLAKKGIVSLLITYFIMYCISVSVNIGPYTIILLKKG